MTAALWVLLVQAALPRFRAETIEESLHDLWDVAAADLNGDGRTDLLALDWEPAAVVWYENPGWKRRVVCSGEPKMPVVVCPFDADGDGVLELVVGADYHEPPDPARGGTIWLLRRDADLDRPWKARRIEAAPTLHRIHPFGPRALACSALHGPLFVLRPGEEGAWRRETVAADLHVLHNTASVDWDEDGRPDLLAASREGITLFRSGRWERRAIGSGHQGRGSSEVAVGRLPGGGRYVAAVEPHHGHELAVYTAAERAEAPWTRRVLRVHKGGHTLAPARLTAAPVDSMLVGFVGQYSDHPGGPLWMVVHPLDAAGLRWETAILDESGLPGEDGLWADLNGDGRPDAVVGGGKRVRIWWNEGAAR